MCLPRRFTRATPAGSPGADVSAALAALINSVTARPSTSWRVGVGCVTADDQAKVQEAAAAAAATAAAAKRIVLHHASTKTKAKPAVMTVSGTCIRDVAAW
jgi:hypothetical protein